MSSEIVDGTPFFSAVVEILQRLEIPYMVTGSMCCTAYGEPRSTNDVDIVIDPTLEQLNKLIESFLESAYVSNEAALDAYKRRTMFNVISNETIEKIDFILLKDTPYQTHAFERKGVQNFGTVEAVAIAPEDAILSKLVWSKRSLSEVQFRDIAGIVSALSNKLDRDYLNHWGTELKVLPRLQEIFTKVENDEVSPD